MSAHTYCVTSEYCARCLCVHASDTLSNFRLTHKIFRFAWHSISFVSVRWLRVWRASRCGYDCDCDLCHCCCLYFQFSRSEVYSWYVLYSFRKLSDSRLDPIEDVFTSKQSYSFFLSIYLLLHNICFFFFFFDSVFFPLYSVATFSFLSLQCVFFYSHSSLLHFAFYLFQKVSVFISKTTFYFPISVRSFFFQVNIWVVCFIWTKHQHCTSTCNAFHSYQMQTGQRLQVNTIKQKNSGHDEERTLAFILKDCGCKLKYLVFGSFFFLLFSIISLPVLLFFSSMRRFQR